MKTTTQYRARFTPQAWINDYAVEIDAEGETEWDVTPEYLDELVERSIKWNQRKVRAGEAMPLTHEEALAEIIEISTNASDNLRYDPAAPEWILEHQGPFHCEAWPVNE